MAYSNIWNEAAPLGSAPAADIDLFLRTSKVDIRERIADVLGIADFTADPIVPTKLNLGRTTTAKIIGGSTSLSLRNNADSADNLLLTDAGYATIRDGMTAKYAIMDTDHTPVVQFNRNGVIKGIIGTSDNGSIITGQSADSLDIRSSTGRINFATALGSLAFYAFNTKQVNFLGDFGPDSTFSLVNTSDVLAWDCSNGQSQYYPTTLTHDTSITISNMKNGHVYRAQILDPGNFIVSFNTTVNWHSVTFPSTALTSGKSVNIYLWSLGTTLYGQWSQAV